MPNSKDKNETKKNAREIARETPNNYEAEMALIGGMLIDGPTASRFMPQLHERDFYTPRHKYIFMAMNDLFRVAKPIDFVTVVGALETRGELELAGGVDYLSQVIAATPTVANSEYYFALVKKVSQLRAILIIAERMASQAYSLDPDDTALENAEAALYKLAESTRRGKPERIDGFVMQVMEDLKARSTDQTLFHGVPTGFPRLDNILGGGFQPSDLIILAARPGQGKTSFAINCAVNAARRTKSDGTPFHVAVFSLEMSATQLAKRMLCSVAGFDMGKANKAVIGERDWEKLYDARDELNRTCMYVDESGDIKPAEILSKCRALKREKGLDLVVIDYLQLMQSGKRTDNFVREIAEITRALKLAAKELNVPILLLSQMSRSIEQRKGNDKESKLSDLRDSGAIEQDADIVLFIDRKETPGADGKAADVYLNIAKHRNGATGNVKLLWDPSTTTFKPADDKGNPEPPPKGYNGKATGFELSVPPPDEEEAPWQDDEPTEQKETIGVVDAIQQAKDSGLL